MEGWKILKNTGLKRDIDWLDRVSKWNDDGLEMISEGNKITIENNGSEVGEIIDNLLKVKYSNYGGDVVCHSSKTTTILGKFNDVVTGGGISVVKDSKLFKYGENPAGINLLNNPNWTWEINRQWIIDAINRGDIIRVVSNPNHIDNIWIDGIVNGIKTPYGREIELLEASGYRFDSSKYEFVK